MSSSASPRAATGRSASNQSNCHYYRTKPAPSMQANERKPGPGWPTRPPSATGSRPGRAAAATSSGRPGPRNLPLLALLSLVGLQSSLSHFSALNAQTSHSNSNNKLNNNNNNDVIPQQYQHNNILYFEVPEGAPNNTWVGNIRSVDGQPPSLVVPMPQTPDSERKAALNINFSNGDLTTNAVLDREHREQYHFVALIAYPPVEIRCTVTVKDVNDNAPMFLMQSPNETNFVIEMPEGQRGVRKALPIAVDFDSPQFGIKEFRIVSGNTPSGMFQLVEHEAPARSTLQQNGNLPDDSTALLTAGADNPQLMQQLAQQATVLIPSQPVMQSTVSGSGANGVGSNGVGGSMIQGSSVGGANAASAGGQLNGIMSNSGPITANNIGPNAQIPQIATQSKFLIDLEVSQPLDRENQSSYQLVVEAIDGGQPPLVGRLMVTVNVQDVNDNDPVFPKRLYECHFKEDTPKGTLIQRVQAYDVDLDSNGQVSYYIKRYSSSSQPINLINSNSSDNNNYNEVQVSRYSAASMQANGNKLRPLQQQTATASSSSSANNNNNKFPLRPSAGGLEVHDNSAQELLANLPFKSRQSLSYPPDQLFDIDQTKGEIYLVNQLDYETDPVHDITIEARDHGKPSRSSLTTVRVHIIDVPDDAPPIKHEDNKRPAGNQLGDFVKAEHSVLSRSGGDSGDAMIHSGFNFQNFNLASWLAQLNSGLVFVMVLAVILVAGLSVCLVRVKSRQPESEYNDTAGLTLSPNGGQSKPSPNHSSNTIDHHSTGGGVDSLGRYRHHDHQRRPNGSFAGLNGSGTGAFGSPNGKISRYQYMADSSNLYHNPYQPQQRSRHHSSTSHHMVPDSPNDHQMAVGQADSRGGTLALHNHHHHLLGHSPPGPIHPLDHHHQFAGPNHTTSSLTYAHHHSRAALLHQAHHHQSSHQLSSVHQGVVNANKGSTMNSQHSAQHPPSTSPVPATPNTNHSSGLPQNVHETSSHHHHHHHGHHHGGPHNPLLPSLPAPAHHQPSSQLPPTPCHNVGAPGSVFAWPPPQAPGSTIGCFTGPNGPPNGIHVTPGSTMDSCGTAGGGAGVVVGAVGSAGSGNGSPTGTTGCGSQPLDRWFDLGVSSQLIYTHDWCGSYNWDYLSDWTPEYQTLMPLIKADASGF